MSSDYSNPPNRKGGRARRDAIRQRQALASDPNKRGKRIGTIEAYIGIEGGEDPGLWGVPENGGIWVKVKSGSRRFTVHLEESPEYIYSSHGVGNLIGSSVVINYRGKSGDDIENGGAKLLAGVSEQYEHPDKSSPFTIGAFNGARCSPESQITFEPKNSDFKGQS